MFVNFLLALVAAFITYNMSLTIIGEKRPLKEIIPAILVIACGLIISKIILKATLPLHILIYVFILWGYLTLINKVDWLFSMIGSILTILIIVFCSMLISDQILAHSGINLESNPDGIQWVYINLAEYGPQLIVLFLLKSTKISLQKFAQ